MREPRAFAELETKIGQEDKPAQKPVEKEPVSAGQKPDPRKSWELWDKNLSLLKGDDVEASNKAAEEFGAEFSKHLKPEQIDEFDTIIGTFKNPDEVEAYMTKVIGDKPSGFKLRDRYRKSINEHKGETPSFYYTDPYSKYTKSYKTREEAEEAAYQDQLSGEKNAKKALEDFVKTGKDGYNTISVLKNLLGSYEDAIRFIIENSK